LERGFSKEKKGGGGGKEKGAEKKLPFISPHNKKKGNEEKLWPQKGKGEGGSALPCHAAKIYSSARVSSRRGGRKKVKKKERGPRPLWREKRSKGSPVDSKKKGKSFICIEPSKCRREKR